ncbi:hypothetical protein C1646_673161 [Rhizophagus diaphanus]|nr:hypothetical protein C1646_673161 [Rhizophagus diaphanus] [Rhizophagus sp. MUCL 43196]
MSNIIIHPYIFEENNLVPTLSEFIRLNTDLVARSPPDSNKSAALQGACAKRFTYVASVLNISKERYRVRLRPELQIQLNNEQIRMIGEMVKYEGIHGAVCKLRKIIQNIEELNIEEPDLFDDEPTNNKTLSLVLEENDYLDKEMRNVRQKNSATKKLRKGHRYVHQKTHFCLFRRYSRNPFVCFIIIPNYFSLLTILIISQISGEMVSRSSRDRRSEASDAPDKVEGFHLDWMFTKLLRFTVSRFKRIMKRAEKEKFIPGKVTIIEAKESRTPKKPKNPKSEEA